jgi:hypothetical protein
MTALKGGVETFGPKQGNVLNRQTIINQATGWTVQGLNHGGSKIFFSSPKYPDQLWGKPTLLF